MARDVILHAYQRNIRAEDLRHLAGGSMTVRTLLTRLEEAA